MPQPTLAGSNNIIVNGVMIIALDNVVVVPTGVLLGDPANPILIENVARENVVHAENISDSPQKLAINLLKVLFTHQEISHGNCTKPNRDDITILNPTKIQAIRGKYIA